MSGLEDLDLFNPPDQLDDALASGRAWHGARERVIDSFRHWGTSRRSLPWQSSGFLGLVYPVSGLFLETMFPRVSRSRLPCPFGWRWAADWDRDVYLLMPTWLYLARRLWNARWSAYRTLARLGFIQAGEGEYLTLRGLTWRWWKDARVSRRHPYWYELGWSIERLRARAHAGMNVQSWR